MHIVNYFHPRSDSQVPTSLVRPRTKQATTTLILALGAVLAVVLASCTGGSLRGSSTGWSPAAVSDGVVYIGTKQGEVKAIEDGFNSARVKWTFCVRESANKNKCDDDLDGVYDAPVVGEDLVYVAGVDGYLYAIEKETGTIGESGWSRAVGSNQDPEPLIAAPVLDNDRNQVLVGSEDGHLYAFDSRGRDTRSQDSAGNGQNLLKWSFPRVGRIGDIWSTPVIGGNLVYFGSHDNNVYAVDLDDGDQVWRFSTNGSVAGRPLLFKDLVVVGSFDRKLYALDATTGTKRWEFMGNDWFWAGAVTDGVTIFAPSMDDHIYALDADGNLLWKQDMGSSIVSRPVMVPQGLVVATKSGKISVLDTSRENLGDARVRSVSFVRGGQVKAPLFAVGDSIFVGTQDSTVARFNTNPLGEDWCVSTKIPTSAISFQEIRCD